ncbi:MAG: hypothetical protein FH762_07215 [Firmicutes bacterium]|nr:hypothetical protein [Bacillota bacterium]
MTEAKQEYIEGIDKYIYRASHSTLKQYNPLNLNSDIFLQFANLAKNIDFLKSGIENYKYIDEGEILHGYTNMASWLKRLKRAYKWTRGIPLDFFKREINKCKTVVDSF